MIVFKKSSCMYSDTTLDEQDPDLGNFHYYLH